MQPRGPALASGPALVIAALAAVTIATVWIMQSAGYTPCELCLLERDPYYAGLPLALLVAWAAGVRLGRAAAVGYGVLAVIFLAGAVLAAYHAGVEWQFWAGPTGCSGSVQAAPAVGDFLKQLDAVKVIRCDAAALRVLGLSLAGWNVPLSLVLCGLAVAGVRQTWRLH